MSTWLGNKRKPELVALADEAGFDSAGRLKKEELVNALDEHLQSNATRLSHVQSLAPYYQRTGSPSKRETGATATMTSDGEVKSIVRARGRRATKVKEESDADRSPQSPTPALAATRSRTPAQPRLAPPSSARASSARAPLPPSPAVVTDAIEQQTARISAGFDDFVTSTRISDFFGELREMFSSVIGVEMTILLLESYYLQQQIMPWRYAFDTPPSKLLGLNSQAISLPDLFILLTGFYWSTLTLWSSISIWLPLLASWFWNLTMRTRTQNGATVVLPKSRCDPMTFNVVKALLAWLIFGQGKRFWGLVADETVDRVRMAMPGGYTGIMIGSFIGILASLYDAALKK